MVYVFIKILIWYSTQATIGKKEKRIYIYAMFSRIKLYVLTIYYMSDFGNNKKETTPNTIHKITRLVQVTLFFWLLIF